MSFTVDCDPSSMSIIFDEVTLLLCCVIFSVSSVICCYIRNSNRN